MPHDFAEYEREPESQASGRFSGPPRKHAGIGILDPPVPPKRAPGPIPAASMSLLWRITAAVILAALAAMTIILLFAKH
jgi:hypothetical protein